LGGGVVGDITGFVAATFMRGVDYIQIPTTLLAMVDSSIGGKTGINLDSGKNLVGSIYQPKSVFIDPQFIQSLPSREVVSAFGEIIKYGAILDRTLLLELSENFDDLISMKDTKELTKIIHRCARLKAEIVSRDENENDLRRILNFGHTIGHALEKYFGFDVLRHGEAVSYGMLAAIKLSQRFSTLSNEDSELLSSIIKKLPLPQLPDFNVEKVYEIITRDKKTKNGKINFVLLSTIGKTNIVDSIDRKEVLEILNKIR